MWSLIALFLTPFNLAILCVISALFIYWQYTKEYGKWEKKGLFSIRPTVSAAEQLTFLTMILKQFFFGNQGDLYMQRKDLWTIQKDFYEAFKGHR